MSVSEVISVYILTMGCAKNEVDSDKMRASLQAAGYRMVDEPEGAQAVIVNTCSFIQSATEESLQAIFDMAGLPGMESGDAKLIVAGCMPARYGDELTAELSEASAFVPCSKEDDIAAILDALFPHRQKLQEAVAEPELLSAYVKISDGCNRFCSFCSIPYIRGRYHSFAFERIDADVAAQIERGAREIVLIAQDTGRWGDDFDEPSTLASLMAKLAEKYPDTWFRVMYLQPEGITDELLDVMRSHENICSYLDIPFQHANERILSRMNRKGDAAQYLELIAHIRDMVPGITLRTTLIAGFPGETEDDFEELCDFVEEIDFDYVGVFPYSQEEGTRAAKFDDQIDDDVKLERAQAVRDIADAISRERVAARVGSELDVIVLGSEEDGQLFGRAKCQAPDVDGVVYVHEGQIGDIVRVTIQDTLMYEMEGE